MDLEEVVIKKGDAVHDSTHGLTDDQQAASAKYAVVAAAPIRDEKHRKIGVVSCITEKSNEYFEQPEGHALLRETALVLGVLMSVVRDSK